MPIPQSEPAEPATQRRVPLAPVSCPRLPISSCLVLLAKLFQLVWCIQPTFILQSKRASAASPPLPVPERPGLAARAAQPEPGRRGTCRGPTRLDSTWSLSLPGNKAARRPLIGRQRAAIGTRAESFPAFPALRYYRRSRGERIPPRDWSSGRELALPLAGGDAGSTWSRALSLSCSVVLKRCLWK